MGFSKKIIALVLAGSIAFQYADLDFAAYFDSAHYHTVTFLSDSDGCTLEPGLEEDPDFAEAWIRSADAVDDENIETPSEIGTSSDAIPADLSNKEIPATISEIPSTSEIPDQSGRSGTENHLQKIQICVPDGECMAFNEIPEPVLQEGYKFNGWENHQEVYNEDEILDIPVYEDMTFTADIEELPELLELSEQTLTAHAGNQIITVTGLLPEGAEVLAEQIPLNEAQKIAADETGKTKPEICFALDISILVNGVKYQPEDYGKSVTVTISNLDIAEGQEVSVLHVKEDESIETLNTQKTGNNSDTGTGGSASFEAKSFSEYLGIIDDTTTPVTFKVYDGADFEAAVEKINKREVSSCVISLQNDINFDDVIKLDDFIEGSTTIIGNGHTMHMNGRSIHVYNNLESSAPPELTLGDKNDPQNTLTIDGGNEYFSNCIVGCSQETGTAQYAYATLNILEGVTIQNVWSNGGFAGAAVCAAGICNMSGIIQNVKVFPGCVGGGGIGVLRGVCNMTGGIIQNCDVMGSSLRYGGGVCVMPCRMEDSAVFNMTGGVIQNNKAVYGGGVAVLSTVDGDDQVSFIPSAGAWGGSEAAGSGTGGNQSSTTVGKSEFNMSGDARIINNQAVKCTTDKENPVPYGGNGGGVYIMPADNAGGIYNPKFKDLNPVFNMNGGTIEGNTAEYLGGGVAAYAPGNVLGEGTFNFNGGSIQGNSAKYGGGIGLMNQNSETAYAHVNINGSSLCSITGNTAEMGGGIFNGNGKPHKDVELTLKGNIQVKNNTGKNVCLYDIKAGISGPVDASSEIGVYDYVSGSYSSPAVSAAPFTVDYSKYNTAADTEPEEVFFSDWNGYAVSWSADQKEAIRVKQYTIASNAGDGGTVAPSGSVKAIQGKDQTFTVTPSDDYIVDLFTVDGKAVDLNGTNSYTLTNVQGDHTINVSFKKLNRIDLGDTLKFKGDMLVRKAGETDYITENDETFAVATGNAVDFEALIDAYPVYSEVLKLRDGWAAQLVEAGIPQPDAGQQADMVPIRSLSSAYTAIFTIPDISIPDSWNGALSLKDKSGSGLYQIDSTGIKWQKQERKLTVPMKLSKDYAGKTVGELLKDLSSICDGTTLPLALECKDLTVGEADNGTIQISGELSGSLSAVLTGSASSYHLDYSFTGVQAEGGKDAALSDSDSTISVTMQHQKTYAINTSTAGSDPAAGSDPTAAGTITADPQTVSENGKAVITIQREPGHKIQNITVNGKNADSNLTGSEYALARTLTVTQVNKDQDIVASFESMTASDIENEIKAIPSDKAVPAEEYLQKVLIAKMDYEAGGEERKKVSEEQRNKLNAALIGLSEIITVEVEKKSGSAADMISDKAMLLENMTLEEAAALQSKTDIGYRIIVKIAPADAADADIDSLKTALDNARAAGQYQITLSKIITHANGEVSTVPLFQISDPIQFLLPVSPDQLTAPSGYSRSFSVLRTHDSNGDVRTEKLSFQLQGTGFLVSSDLFSLFTIACKDTVISPDDGKDAGSPSNPSETDAPSHSSDVSSPSNLPDAGSSSHSSGTGASSVTPYTGTGTSLYDKGGMENNIRDDNAVPEAEKPAESVQTEAETADPYQGNTSLGAKRKRVSPATGDRSEMVLWLILLSVSAILLAVYTALLKISRKRKGS